jgi:hypothetical protein
MGCGPRPTRCSSPDCGNDRQFKAVRTHVVWDSADPPGSPARPPAVTSLTTEWECGACGRLTEVTTPNQAP